MPTASASLAVGAVALAKRYGTVTALSDLTLRVERGSIFGFLGANGAGKTTAVKMLLGLVRPTSGTAHVLGAPIGDRETRRRIGYLPELFRYPEWLSAREVLAFHASLLGTNAAQRTPDIARALTAVGLSERADDRVATYSKGMQQRLGLGVALLGNPALVVLDEPTSALDPLGRYDVRALLAGLRERGTTVFLNSHLLTEVELVCDRIAIVKSGRVISSGTREEILGEQRGLRIRARADGVSLHATLASFGDVTESNGAIVLRDVAHERTPEIVAALVTARARVYAVEPIVQTLEERFIELAGSP
ncbi:MAG TPA: ABC transporter ATP-binding protein [Candidatus Dormibacteraeota bacterium]|nr:ABC transporter ATP-binding protein [Candidatus Dormibacteraeota bacterium]